MRTRVFRNSDHISIIIDSAEALTFWFTTENDLGSPIYCFNRDRCTRKYHDGHDWCVERIDNATYQHWYGVLLQSLEVQQ